MFPAMSLHPGRGGAGWGGGSAVSTLPGRPPAGSTTSVWKTARGANLIVERMRRIDWTDLAHQKENNSNRCAACADRLLVSHEGCPLYMRSVIGAHGG
jgi:hypothetical protein